MKKLISFIKYAGTLALLSTPVLLWAEDVPVYDADNYPPQFDGQYQGNTVPSTPRAVPYVAPVMTLEQRIGQIEQRLDNIQHAYSSSKLEALQSEVQSLRNQVEELNHQLQQTQTQDRALIADLEKKLSKQVGDLNDKVQAKGFNPNRKAYPKVAVNNDLITDSSNTNKDTVAANKTAASDQDDDDQGNQSKTDKQPNVAEEQQIYQNAYNLIKAKKYDDAVSTLKNMLQKYPSGQFAANAHYWLGELYNLMNNNSQSAAEFNRVISDYPDSPKVSDAQLKLGLIYVSQSKWSDAKAALRKVVNRYPGTASARLAAEQLKQIRSSGH